MSALVKCTWMDKTSYFQAIKFKHEAFGKFKEWNQLAENQTGRTVKKLRTDNGLEFCNREFEQLCIESGIDRHLIVVGTPQQNGVAERMNRILMDKVRCLLIQSGLLKTFWTEATCTAAYLINRSPSRAIEKKTHMEMWSGHRSDYGMLRIFGCVAYPHDKQGKLELRAVKCVLLGYLEGVKGYILYRLDDESPKIVTSMNVDFNESVMYKDTLKDSDADDKFVKELLVPLRFRDEKDMDSLRKNKTWELVDHPAGQKLLDVKTAFLHGNLKEVIYMKQPPGYEQGNKVFLLKKSLYGLKQSPRQWYKSFNEYMLNNGFKHSNYDSSVYYRSYAPGSTKSLLKKEFDIKELGEANEILGMEIVGNQSRKIMRASQSGMSKVSYANAVGILMYLMVCTRSDIAYAATLQHVVALSTTEAEYMALTEALKEAIWLRRLLEELGVELNIVAVNCDNQDAIHLSWNHVFHERTKHINVRYHFIREVLGAKTVKILNVGIEHNVANALTKIIPELKLQHCLELLNVGVG
nr:retrovirus-related Pol polyprotein from transposon TNT 1-94 [Tanacetum cinerariifolium]